jgi:hypothetical protein
MAWRTTAEPRTEFVTLRLTVAEAADLDTMAADNSMNRSEAVRWSVNRVVAAEKRKKAKQQTQAEREDGDG